MKTFAALVSLAIVALLGLAALAVPASAAPAAAVPTWHVGQAVGYGTTVNLTGPVQPLLDVYKQNLTDAGATVNALAFTGSVDVWVVDTVTGATSSTYTLSEQTAAGLKLHFVANLTTSLPDPGTYAGDRSTGSCVPNLTLPSSQRAIAVTLDWSSLENGTTTATYQAANLATTKQVANVTLRAKGSLSGYNAPKLEFNATSCVETIAYGPQDLGLAVNTQSSTRVTYVPALDTFHFPITDGNTWWANSTATVSGKVSGTIDVTGLSASDEQSFFQNVTDSLNSLAGVSVSGLTGFPIDLSKITVTVGLNNVLQNGNIQDYTIPVAESLRATAAVRTLGDQQQHPVYLIGPASYACPATVGSSSLTIAAVYAPDYPSAGAGMVAGYEGITCLLNTNYTAFSLSSVPVAQASSKQQQTQQQYNPFPAAANPLADFFLASPYLGVILIVVVVVAVAALVVLRGRRKRSNAPPPAQPPTPPPPGTP